MPNQRYSCGFVFNTSLTKVALIRKNRGPFNMKGRLNGIGGKKEDNENEVECQSREFFEETTVLIPKEKWKFVWYIIQIDNENEKIQHIISFFTSTTEDFDNIKTCTDEVIEIHNVSDIMNDVVSNKLYLMDNLFALIPFAILKLTNRS